MTIELKTLADPVSSAEIRRYVAHGWAAILDRGWMPQGYGDQTTAAFDAWADAAYQWGFVPHDAGSGALGLWWHLVNRDPDRFRLLGLQAIRKWNQLMWRGWSVGGADFAAMALRLGALQAMLRRLSVIGAADDPSANLQSSPSVPTADSYGGILFGKEDRVLLLEPTGHFGGYAWTFPKGRPLPGETPEETAVRAVAEKTGYEAEIFDVLPLAFEGTTSTSAYFLMAPIGDPRPFGNQTKRVMWAEPEEASALLLKTKAGKGRKRDLAVLAAARDTNVSAPVPVSLREGIDVSNASTATEGTGSLVIPKNAEVSLQVMQTVEGLVRKFLVDALAARSECGEGKLTNAEATARVGELSTSMQTIFYGQDPVYESTDWNTPARLGKWITGKADAIPPPTDDAVFRLFNKLFIEVAGPLTGIEAGTTSEDMWEVVVEEAVARYTAHLLGIPSVLLTGEP